MASKVYVFHKTVRGQAHKQKGIPCEDASGSFFVDDGKKQYYIAAVADGHGASACFRSGTGAQIAVDAAIDCLKQCAETWLANIKKLPSPDSAASLAFLQDPFKYPFNLRQLTDAIVARWYDNVMADYRARPFTPEEKRKFPDAGKSKANITRIYGTTLIAALWLSPWLVLIQQGDGRCDVFYEDGHAEQPIPWDERCQDNVTTSMCDLDAASSIRSCLINFAQEKPIACFLESDGVEDAYRDTYDNLGGSHTRMGGVNTFNKMLIGQILKRYVNPEEQAFEETLTGLLSDFSASGQFGRGGSGDDVSVAGIVNHDGIKSYEALYLNDIARYERDESIFWLESALRSKKRKLGILEQRRTQALHDLNGAGQANTALRNALQQKYDEANREYLAFQEDYNAIKRRLDNLKK